MTKQDITRKIVETIEKSAYKKDIREVFLFGSYAYGNPTPESDVDILVDFEPESPITYFDLSDIQSSLEIATKRKVDVLTPGSISKFIRNDVFSKMQRIYVKR